MGTLRALTIDEKVLSMSPESENRFRDKDLRENKKLKREKLL